MPLCDCSAVVQHKRNGTEAHPKYQISVVSPFLPFPLSGQLFAPELHLGLNWMRPAYIHQSVTLNRSLPVASAQRRYCTTVRTSSPIIYQKDSKVG
jgi:hypothetical protein